MNAIDIGFGVLAGVLSCLTPESLLLCPLLLGAARAADRGGVIALAAGLGLSLVLTSIVAGLLGAAFGFEAVWLRRLVCVCLLLQGITLMSESLVERYRMFTGGVPGGFGESDTGRSGGTFRLLLLALFVGANWFPSIGSPTLAKATLMAAGAQNYPLALAVLFAFGFGAALPWIAAGRVLDLVSRPVRGNILRGMGSKRLLGFSLLVVAVLGISGWDLVVEQRINRMLPTWIDKLAIEF